MKIDLVCLGSLSKTNNILEGTCSEVLKFLNNEKLINSDWVNVVLTTEGAPEEGFLIELTGTDSILQSKVMYTGTIEPMENLNIALRTIESVIPFRSPSPTDGLALYDSESTITIRTKFVLDEPSDDDDDTIRFLTNVYFKGQIIEEKDLDMLIIVDNINNANIVDDEYISYIISNCDFPDTSIYTGRSVEQMSTYLDNLSMEDVSVESLDEL